MGGTADERGLNIQYCMSFIRHLLHSTRLPAVTQIRVSDDYILCPVQSYFQNIPGMKGLHNIFTNCFVFTNLSERHFVVQVNFSILPYSFISYGSLASVANWSDISTGPCAGTAAIQRCVLEFQHQHRCHLQ